MSARDDYPYLMPIEVTPGTSGTGSLSGHYFAGLCVPDLAPGTWRSIAKKYDVTDDVRALIEAATADGEPTP